MSFRARLVLGALYVLTAVVLALVIPLALTVERRAESDFETAVLGDAAILAARMGDLVPRAASRPAGAAARRLEDVVAATARERTQRILVLDARGQAVVDSDGSARRGAFLASPERPEFRAALFGGRIDSRRRFSETLGRELLLVTVPVVDDERVVGAVRVSATTDEIAAGVRESWLRLAAIGAAVVAAGLVLAWLLAARVSRQVRELSAASVRLGRGDLGTRAREEGAEELRTLARSFNDMAASLEESIDAQREFVANASHQLRTPLTGLRLRLEAIRTEGGAAAEQAAKGEEELERLSRLVDELLQLASSSARAATPEPVDLDAAARDAVGRWREEAGAAGKELVAADGVGTSAWVDRGDVAHVLDNLVENALRYTPAGTRVTLETERRDGVALLTVSDDGPGISPEDRGRVFERFYRGANGRRVGAGTGLGLAIVAELVERSGGQVRLLEGEGTRIELTFREPPSKR